MMFQAPTVMWNLSPCLRGLVQIAVPYLMRI